MGWFSSPSRTLARLSLMYFGMFERSPTAHGRFRQLDLKLNIERVRRPPIFRTVIEVFRTRRTGAACRLLICARLRLVQSKALWNTRMQISHGIEGWHVGSG